MLFNSCLIFDGVVGSAEYALETEVGQQADVSFFYSIHTTIYMLQKYNIYRKSLICFLSLILNLSVPTRRRGSQSLDFLFLQACGF